MTEPQDLSPERVAELQKQLSDAAAQVAKVQAELGRAQAGPPAPTTPPTAPPVSPPGEPVPYATQVFVSGQPGQQVDLTAMLGAEMADQLRDQLGMLGLDESVAAALGAQPGHVGPAAPTTVARLAEPPRRVPFAFRLSSLWSWSWWEAFAVLMGAVAPIVVWAFFPWTIPAALLLGILAIALVRGRKYVKRIGLLKWGKVATVMNADEISRGTYYSGTTYHNMLVSQANGWDVTRRFYSGPASTTEIKYSLDDVDSTLTLKGLPYNNGVILADSRKPKRALCVSSLPFSVKPDASGEFADPGLSAWSWFGIYCTALLHATLVVAAVLAVIGIWLE